eukprot:gene29062-35479_t
MPGSNRPPSNNACKYCALRHLQVEHSFDLIAASPAKVRRSPHDVKTLLAKLGVAEAAYTGGTMASYSPVTGEKIADIAIHSAADTAKAIEQADTAFREWRLVPAPKRGELVRLFGEELRALKTELGRLVSIEAGKIPSEGLGE